MHSRLIIIFYYKIFAEEFPLLKVNVRDLSEFDKDELLTRLKRESGSIRYKFAGLVAHTLKCLQESGTSNEVVKAFLVNSVDELDDSIEPTDSISAMIDKVRKGGFWSFFNYELLESLIVQFCHEQMRQRLGNYTSEFKAYCARRLSEVPISAIRDENLPTSSSSVFLVKLDVKFSISSCSLGLVKEIQQKIGQILNRKPLLLKNVEDGCIELTFRYFNAYSPVFPLSEIKKCCLAEIGVQWLMYEVQSETGPDIHFVQIALTDAGKSTCNSCHAHYCYCFVYTCSHKIKSSFK